MNILYVASEVAPFAKTGGLADVAGSLPIALAEHGHDVRVILPLYECIEEQWRSQMRFVKCFYVQLAWRNSYCGIFELVRDGVTYWFVDNEYYFKRAGLYGHYDDAERFAFFCRSVMSVPEQLEWTPDILHANDWETALVPIYLLEDRSRSPRLCHTKSVFTIHNIEYQGQYGSEILGDVLGLDDGYFNDRMLEFRGDVNLMKGAIYAADSVTTVSPTYAEELQYAFYAHGLEGVIADCEWKIKGIINGLDTELYDPAADPVLAQRFSAEQTKGKKVCKAVLQHTVELKENSNVPVVACISRLVAHKGFDLIVSALDRIMEQEVQMVVLGTGDWNYEEFFRRANARYRGRFAARLQYSSALSNVIYAGADLLLMPSVSEPCGLSQMIAMRYGTIPIVRETGGLKDTVRRFSKEDGEGNGFTFSNVDANDMVAKIQEAVELYQNEPDTWTVLRSNAMTSDFSWEHSAQSYLEIYAALSDSH
jgi:starch synthase